MRRLIYHAESECLFEVNSEEEWIDLCENGDGMCADVTGEVEFEERFKREKDEKGNDRT